MAACSIDLILNAEVSGTTSTNIGSARIITGSNTQASFRAMMGTSTLATASVEVKRFTGATSILKLNTAGIGLQDVSGSQRTIGDSAVTGSWATGKVDSYSLEFPASSDDYINIPMGASTGSSNGESGSIAAWIYRDSETSYPIIFSTSQPSENDEYSFFGFFSATNQLGWQIYQGGSEIARCLSTATIATGAWTHVTVTCDGTNTKFYINGIQSTTIVTAGDGAWFADGDANTTSAYVGNLGFNSVHGFPFSGKLDEVAVWTEPLNLGGVQALYNGGSGAKADTVSSSYLVSYYDMEDGPGASTLADRTGNGYNGTLTNMLTGSLLLVDDWYDFYASGSAADVSTLVKGIRVILQ